MSAGDDDDVVQASSFATVRRRQSTAVPRPAIYVDTARNSNDHRPTSDNADHGTLQSLPTDPDYTRNLPALDRDLMSPSASGDCRTAQVLSDRQTSDGQSPTDMVDNRSRILFQREFLD